MSSEEEITNVLIISWIIGGGRGKPAENIYWKEYNDTASACLCVV